MSWKMKLLPRKTPYYPGTYIYLIKRDAEAKQHLELLNQGKPGNERCKVMVAFDFGFPEPLWLLYQEDDESLPEEYGEYGL
jgi:hypothetical protein